MFSSNASQVSNDANYIEDVFSTWLYTGAAGTTTQQTITNGIDLLGEGGLVWVKRRSGTAVGHYLVDTARGAGNFLGTEATTANTNNIYTISGFTSSGFQLGQSSSPYFSAGVWGAENYASWTFRKQPKFFDVVTYTGTGTPQNIAHSLGSTPGCIIVKCTSNADNWGVWHRSLNNSTGYLLLNSTAASGTSTSLWGNTAPTSTTFTVGNNGITGASGFTYVAYLFAHNAGGFGESGEDNVISCGSFTTDGSGLATVDLGYEPQYVLVKRTSASSDWFIFDTMRGLTVNNDNWLTANTADAESSGLNLINPTSTGFTINFSVLGYTSASFIYIAIRRGPMKVPTSGTSVLGLSQRMGTGSNATVTGSAGVTDLAIIKNFGSTTNWLWSSRMTNTGYLSSNDSTAETTAATTILQANPWDVMDGVKVGTTSLLTNASGNNFINYLIDRAPGFMDVCCYTGTGVARTVAHNLGVAPELMIVKARSAATAWIIYHSALGNNASLSFSTGAVNTPSTTWNTTTPTSSSFTVGTSGATNGSSVTLVAYLFASCPGVSKVGSYTGTATTQQINCGFTGGARFVLIKRTDSTGDWYVWDSARGIEAGNDGYLLFNSTAIQATGTDYVDTYSAGFEISSTAPAAINASGGSFIFLAIA